MPRPLLDLKGIRNSYHQEFFLLHFVHRHLPWEPLVHSLFKDLVFSISLINCSIFLPDTEEMGRTFLSSSSSIVTLKRSISSSVIASILVKHTISFLFAILSEYFNSS